MELPTHAAEMNYSIEQEDDQGGPWKTSKIRMLLLPIRMRHGMTVQIIMSYDISYQSADNHCKGSQRFSIEVQLPRELAAS